MMRIQVDQVDGRRFKVAARGVELIVDDTMEAGGPGDGFRPSELLMGALATCMAGTMLTFARNQDIPVHGISIFVEDETAEHPERIGTMVVDMKVAADATDRQVRSLERVAAACKIHNTLERSPDIQLAFTVKS
ncbi:MAG: OsmC family protein [Acidimicrobiia bacterium]|nr:OsmC family protein [Acidimicrobiia bacterium]